MSKPIPKKIRDVVEKRADGRCEGCGNIAPLELHHRRFRSRGGEHTVENLVALCGWGNHTGCHGRAHGSDSPQGWAISRWGEPPINIPFQSRHGLVYLTRDGRYADAGPPPF